jgi:hypothetical protein
MSDKKVFFKDLTKKEKAHLNAMGMRTLAQFKATAADQAERRAEYAAEGKSFMEPCYECKNIARKLGLPI